MSELSFLVIAIGGRCGSVARFLVAREMGTLAREFSALRHSGSECSGFTGPGLAGNGVSGSSVNQ